MSRNAPPSDELEYIVFDSPLGWFGVIAQGELVVRLTFNQPSAVAAFRAIMCDRAHEARRGGSLARLERRLQRYARQGDDPFLDVPIDLGPKTPFQRAVIECCRRIPCGSTLSYGALAEQAGYPNAARAVGSVMSRNRIPLIVPCHRVVGSAGGWGGYSMGPGIELKQRLLALEGFQPPRSAHRGRSALTAAR